MFTLRTLLYLLAGALTAVLAYDWWRSSQASEIDMDAPMMELGDALRQLHTERGDDEEAPS